MSDEKSGFNYNLIIVVVLSVLLATGSSYFMITKLGGVNNKSKSVSTAKELGPTSEIGGFLVNLAGGRRFIKVDIVFEVSNDKVGTEIKERTPQIRDTIISILRSKEYKEITSSSGTRGLRTGIMKKINNDLLKGRVTNVFFTKFVVQ